MTFKWQAHSNYHSDEYTSQHVNVLLSMIRRNYQKPFQFYCVTDDLDGLGEGIVPVPLWEDYARIRNPSNAAGPSCYRRLKLFSAEAKDMFGERILCLDLDTVITGDMEPLWNRTEDFIAWGDTHPHTHYNGSMFMLTAGSRQFIWDEFDPFLSPRQTHALRFFGSDQGWLSYRLGPKEARWGIADGIYSWRKHIYPNKCVLPADCRVVMFHGKHKPWHAHVLSHEWVRQHWK